MMTRRGLTEGPVNELGAFITTLLDYWGLPTVEQAAILGLPTTTLDAVKQGTPLPDDERVFHRVTLLFHIQLSLRILFGQDRERRYGWPTKPWPAFGGRTPASLMQDAAGLQRVQSYLQRQWLPPCP